MTQFHASYVIETLRSKATVDASWRYNTPRARWHGRLARRY